MECVSRCLLEIFQFFSIFPYFSPPFYYTVKVFYINADYFNEVIHGHYSSW